MPFQIKLQLFEGPLDLLLYLIRKREIDVKDISVSTITREFLEYVELMEELDIDSIGDFLAMTATLLRIKSSVLLPVLIDEEGEEFSPQEALMKQLALYEKYKHLAFLLANMEDRADIIFPRGAMRKHKTITRDVDINIMELFLIFQELASRKPQTGFVMPEPKPSVEEKMKKVESIVRERGEVSLFELCKEEEDLLSVMALFVATLELARLRVLSILQESMFGEIYLLRRNNELEDKIPGRSA